MHELHNGDLNPDTGKVQASITAVPIATVTIAPIPDKTYTSFAITPALDITFGGTPLVQGTDYTVSYSDNVNVGTATVKIKGMGNFKDSTTTTFNIVPAHISLATFAPIPNQVHTRDSIKPALNLTFAGNTLVVGTDYMVVYENNVDIGTATAKVTGIGNFTGTVDKYFVIVPDTFMVTLNVNNPMRGSVTGAGRYVEYTTATLTATANTRYHFVKWSNGSTDNPYTIQVTSDTVLTAIFAIDCGPGITVTDVDNNVYNTVAIGDQCWLRENLRTTRYADGSAVASHAIYYSDLYPDTAANLATYGRLYTWYSAAKVAENDNAATPASINGNVQGICPNGWHLPSRAELQALLPYGAPQLKATTTWIDNSGNNGTGFTAVAAGYYNGIRFENLGGATYFWSSTHQTDSYTNPALLLQYDCAEAAIVQVNGSYKVSVRCVMNE